MCQCICDHAGTCIPRHDRHEQMARRLLLAAIPDSSAWPGPHPISRITNAVGPAPRFLRVWDESLACLSTLTTTTTSATIVATCAHHGQETRRHRPMALRCGIRRPAAHRHVARPEAPYRMPSSSFAIPQALTQHTHSPLTPITSTSATIYLATHDDTQELR